MNPNGNVKHGGHGTPTYARWKAMMQRCNDPRADNYPYYGGKGITVCERWQDFASFLTDMGECPERMTVDRIDSKKDYEPGNCRWATQAEQNRNRPSHALMLTHAGRTLSATDWAHELGIRPGTLIERVRLGWSHERAITTPLKQRALGA